MDEVYQYYHSRESRPLAKAFKIYLFKTYLLNSGSLFEANGSPNVRLELAARVIIAIGAKEVLLK